MKRVLVAAILVSGCGAKQLMQKPASEPSAGPAGLRSAEAADAAGPGPDSPNGACSSPECEEACKDAGTLAPACANAFAAGCFSDLPPDDLVCDWRAQKKKELLSDEAEDSDEADKESTAEDGAGAESNTGLKVRAYEHSD